ncbi:hypothetical protein BO85DRAFT_88715 [Aspergillus piperis CBS 112811]|uniref:Uncharacterized protein n=1 Tax=Aspergillus piperis CBS 112811 TaxID=1448313 RepID=A0A8G1VJS6_9EURO|nr:hypothetical protein BO85DRAFT_88715 [Aspergillus piperis CBS 112811]RAH54980.1 hypothetical protein BO85DRAFT_88715 [Aspergillus piperis CBS 112811]
MSVAMVEIQSLKLWPPLHLSVCFVTWRGGCLRHEMFRHPIHAYRRLWQELFLPPGSGFIPHIHHHHAILNVQIHWLVTRILSGCNGCCLSYYSCLRPIHKFILSIEGHLHIPSALCLYHHPLSILPSESSDNRKYLYHTTPNQGKARKHCFS